MMERKDIVTIGVAVILALFVMQSAAEEIDPSGSDPAASRSNDPLGTVVSEEELEDNRTDQGVRVVVGDRNVGGEAARAADTRTPANTTANPPGQEQASPDVGVFIPLFGTTSVTGGSVE